MNAKRVVMGLAVAALILAGLWWDHRSGTARVALGLVALLVPLALFELYAMTARAGQRPFWRLGLIAAGVLLVGRFSHHGEYERLGYLLVALAITVAALRRGPGRETLVDAALTVLGVVYVAWLAGFYIPLRRLPQAGESAFFCVLWLAKGGDAAAYFAGKTLGRHPLAQRVSPNKTWEGAAAHLLFGALVGVVFALWTPLGQVLPAWYHGMAFGIVVGVAAQFGDLVESLLKRGFEVKDSAGSGVHFAEMGGVLDLIDSLLFAGPVAWFFLRAVQILG